MNWLDDPAPTWLRVLFVIALFIMFGTICYIVGHTLIQGWINDGICEAALGPDSEWVTGNLCTVNKPVPGDFK